MTRRCSVMRMPLDAHRASMSLALVTVATLSLRRARPFSTNAVTSRVEERAQPCCDPDDPNNRLRDGRRREIQRGHRACEPECCPRQLPGTLDGHRYLPDAVGAGRATGAKVRGRVAQEQSRLRESPLHRWPCATK